MLRRVLLVALLGGLACDGFPLTREVRVQRFPTVAAALDRDPETDVLEFTAIPRPDLKGWKTRSTAQTRHQSGSTHTAVMIPLVDPGWTPDQPVAVWVRLDVRTDDPESPAMQAEINALLEAAEAGPLRVNATQTLPEKVDMDGTNAFTIGAKLAMKEHGLTSPVGAVLATWPAKTKGKVRLVD
ncbi:MAG: hypothetical protein ACRBN8_41215 [Nannocystales bacterium]